MTVRVLPGIACATPPGVNPLVRYVNHAAVIASARPVLVAGPLRGEVRGSGIVVPRVPSPAHRDIEDADRDLEDWWRGLENGLSEAFSVEMERVLGGGKVSLAVRIKCPPDYNACGSQAPLDGQHTVGGETDNNGFHRAIPGKHS